MPHVSLLRFFPIPVECGRRDVRSRLFTVEVPGRHAAVVFDSKVVLVLLTNPQGLDYLIPLLYLFVHVRVVTLAVADDGRYQQLLRFDTTDPDRLSQAAAPVGERGLSSLFQSVADLCLFAFSVFLGRGCLTGGCSAAVLRADHFLRESRPFAVHAVDQSS